MNYEYLRTFVAVVKHGSFRSAAQQLHKTQPSVSASIKKLEQYYDLVLFDRSSYRPKLSVAGEHFYQQAQQLMIQSQKLDLLGHQLATGADPVLGLTLSPMCELQGIVAAIKGFQEQQPRLQLNIGMGHLSGILEPLRKQRSDLAIGPNIGADGHFALRQLTTMHMVTVAAPGLFGGSNRGVLSQRLVRPQPQILLADSGSISPVGNINVISGAQRWYVSDYFAKKQLLLSAMGWARIPRHLVEQELTQGLLETIEIQDFSSQSEVGIFLIRNREIAIRQTVEQFWNFIIKQFKAD